MKDNKLSARKKEKLNQLLLQSPSEKVKELSLKQIKQAIPWYFEIGLKPREILFIFYYCQSFNQRESYVKAGYHGSSLNSIDASVSSLLKREKIKEGIKRYLDEILGVQKDKLENEIFNILYRQMTYDPSMFIDPKGSPKFKTWDEIPIEWRCCIAGIETRVYGKDANVSIVTLKLYDRERAINNLAKYIEMFKEGEIILKVPEETKKKLDDMRKKGRELEREKEKDNE